ncbi:hypothetical protein SUGI_0833580 [Cryptomeria japonica]|nr:hypothetical protein SUGI_0833580 [Cryptomeria japonica]
MDRSSPYPPSMEENGSICVLVKDVAVDCSSSENVLKKDEVHVSFPDDGGMVAAFPPVDVAIPSPDGLKKTSDLVCEAAAVETLSPRSVLGQTCCSSFIESSEIMKAGQVEFIIPNSLLYESVTWFRSSLVGRFCGSHLNIHIVRRWILRIWKLRGQVEETLRFLVWIRLPYLFWSFGTNMMIVNSFGQYCATDKVSKLMKRLLFARFCVYVEKNQVLPTHINIASKFGKWAQQTEVETLSIFAILVVKWAMPPLLA